MAPDNPDSDVRKTARRWLLRLASGEVDERTLGELKHWRRTDVRHNAAFEAERRLYRSLQPLELAFARDALDPPPAIAAPRPRRVARRLSMLAALTAVAAFAWWSLDPLVAWQADKRTAVGEIASIDLPDGSTAVLDSDSAFAMDFSGSERRVHLLRGEVWFKVRHDVRHPFIVDADGTKARAVGTAFAVRKAEHLGTMLTVTEGRVRFTDTSGQELDVVAGQAATLASGRAPAVIRSSDGREELSWRYGRITFENRSLREVASILERYRGGQIWVLGTAADRRVSGVLSVGAIDEGLSGLAAAQRLHIVHITPWLIVLS